MRLGGGNARGRGGAALRGGPGLRGDQTQQSPPILGVIRVYCKML